MRWSRSATITTLLGLALLAGCAKQPVAVAQQPAPASAAPTGFAVPPNPMIGGVPMYPSRDCLANLMQSPDHRTFVAALEAAGLSDTLRQPGPVTVFAPTDAAFRMLPAGLLDDLMKPANRTRLAAILALHIVPGRLDSSTLGRRIAEANGSTELTTNGGPALTARPNGAVNLLLRDPNGGFANISIYDVIDANGVIHVIDKVLQPAQAP